MHSNECILHRMKNLTSPLGLKDDKKIMNDKRDKQLDGVKGLAIILVLLGHIIAYSNPENLKNNLLFNVIYSFHMPLFFFVSGWLVFNRFGPTTLTWIGKKFMRLVIPYTIFTLFYFFVLFRPSIADITPLRLGQALLSFTVPDSAWFLPVLFELLLILALLINAGKAIGEYSFIVFFFMVFFLIPLTSLDGIPAIHQIAVYSPFVIGGFLVSKHKERLSVYITSIEIAGSVLFILLFSLKHSGFLSPINSNLFHLYYFYTLAATGIILSWSAIKLLVNYKISYLFLFCGILSMELYLTHLVILNYFTFRHWPIWFGTGTVAILSGTLGLLTLSLILSLTLSFNKKISAIIFGRWSFRSFSQL